MSYSYWENKHWIQNNDFIIVGSGIVGLTCAISLNEKFPKSKILILEKGILPEGASTKNAGFACFGSVSELINDLKNHSNEEVFKLVSDRYNGLLTLRSLIGDKDLDYQNNFGYEIFLKKQSFEKSYQKLNHLNELLHPLFKDDVFKVTKNKFNFKNCISKYIVNQFEGQLDPGRMISKLLNIAHQRKIKILNQILVKDYSENQSNIQIHTNYGDFTSSKLIFATNGFSKNIINTNVIPARGQVLITKPIKNLNIKGVFHLDKGYYYFRNIDYRILIGGGRNLDFQTESTNEFGKTELIQSSLKKLLNTVIIPEKEFEIDYSWSGIMGVGEKKKPIVKQLSNHVYCGVRLGGMGVAIGASVGRDLASLVGQ